MIPDTADCIGAPYLRVEAFRVELRFGFVYTSKVVVVAAVDFFLAMVS